jgi:hypothetical protein
MVSPSAPAKSADRHPEANLAARMIAYQQRTIEAIKANLRGDISPELRQIAERSIAKQETSVEELRAWLARQDGG